MKFQNLLKLSNMRAQVELIATSGRLERAAENGPDAGKTAARLAALRTVVGDLIARVECALPQLAAAGPGVAAEAARHLLQAGGKRVRPLLLVLSARAAGATPAPEIEERLAQAAELVHAATLLHDDVLDDGRMRRGVPAARVLWGNAASVLGGDFLLVRALELTASCAVAGALDELLESIARMIDGEALQLEHRGRADLDPAGYRAVVDGKTASLFAWCGRVGARLARATPATIEALGTYGLRLGHAFQIVDDVLDVEGDPRKLGKSVLSDLREGKLTLPLLYALEAESTLRQKLQAAADADGRSDDVGALADDIVDAVQRTGAAGRARRAAVVETQAALAALASIDEGPAESTRPYREALATIARELCARVS
jgi:octaprenyl-diphosphate synthase